MGLDKNIDLYDLSVGILTVHVSWLCNCQYACANELVFKHVCLYV